ncbi:MAG: lytic transglycosylase domain-containing protein, partial [Candidatus Acidiferrales bacterium]
NKATLIQMARMRAAQFELDPELVCAVIEQESNWNAWATRFEPAFEKKYVEPLKQNGELKTFGASMETEANARATSYGLMQVMGQVAREQGVAIPFLTELCDPDRGLETGCAHLAKHARDKQGRRVSFEKLLLAWNGGGDPGYPNKVLERVSHYLPRA